MIWGAVHIGAVGSIFMTCLMLFTLASAIAATDLTVTHKEIDSLARWPFVLIMAVMCIIMGGYLFRAVMIIRDLAKTGSADLLGVVHEQNQALAVVTDEFRRSIREQSKAFVEINGSFWSLVHAMRGSPCLIGELNQMIDEALQKRGLTREQAAAAMKGEAQSHAQPDA